MAWIAKRGRVYEARWVANGKQHRKSTGIKVAGEPGCPASKAKRLAQQAADSMEQLAAGKTPLNKVLDAVRAVAEVQGVASNVPTVREYLKTIRERKQDRSQGNRARAHAVFESFLGNNADKRIDLITHQTCRDFIQWAAKENGVRLSTVMGYNLHGAEPKFFHRQAAYRLYSRTRHGYAFPAGACGPCRPPPQEVTLFG